MCNARATAIKEQKYAGVRFQYGKDGRQYMVVVVYDENVGKEATVETRIAPHTPGKIELNGTLWKAVSEHTIEANATVTVIAKDNLTFTVKPT